MKGFMVNSFLKEVNMNQIKNDKTNILKKKHEIFKLCPKCGKKLEWFPHIECYKHEGGDCKFIVDKYGEELHYSPSPIYSRYYDEESKTTFIIYRDGTFEEKSHW